MPLAIPPTAQPATGFRRLPWLLCVLVVLLQLGCWFAGVAGGPAKVPLAALEMLLLAGLLWNGWRIRCWIKHASGTSRRPQQVADLTWLALLVCLFGDAVNRNVPERFYRYDDVIQHSYLADSVWFFLPGYTLLIAAIWLATAGSVRPLWRFLSLILAAAGGGFAFSQVLLPGTAGYITWLTGAYAVIIALLLPCAAWIWLAFGTQGLWVAIGAALATVADAMIGQFWLYGSGYYPAIAYANFIVYFVSQALVQQLPLLALSNRRPPFQNSYSSTARSV